MMKNLQIGDWLQHANGKYYQVTRIDELHFACGSPHLWEYNNKFKPIPLTAEILEKNGWVYNNEDEKFFPQTWVGGGLMLQGADDCGYRIVVTSDYDDEDTNNTPFIIIYVHELQHALRLRRIKKEIEL